MCWKINLRIKFSKKIEYFLKSFLPKKYQFKKRIERAIKKLDEPEKMISRADMFSSPEELDALYLKIDRISLKENSFLGWVKSKFLPGKKN